MIKSIFDFLEYKDTLSNSKDIIKRVNEILEENEGFYTIFSRAFRNNPNKGTPPVDLNNVIKYYNKEDHQKRALMMLETFLKFGYPKELELKSSKTKTPVYYSQRDNDTQWWRTCNGSATAMAVKMIAPNKIHGDDELIREVFKIGDITVHSNVDRVVKNKYGLNFQFDTQMTFKELKKDLTDNKPVILSIKHRGTLSNPSGGHMILAYRWEDKGVRVHDPFGNLMTNYNGHNGKSLLYSWEQLNHRWLGAFTPNKGWGRRFKG